MKNHRTLAFAIALLGGASPLMAQTPLHAVKGPAANTQLGEAVCGMGDVNGDGIRDFAVGIPNADNNGSDSGMVRIYSGREGAVLRTVLGSAAGDKMGRAVARAGDIDLDGFPDLLVGAPYADVNGASSGMVKVISGRSGNAIYTIHGPVAGAAFGHSVDGNFDLNLDGRPDFLVGAPFIPTAGGQGKVFIYSGANGSLLLTLASANGGEVFGERAACAGFVNADNKPDFIVGASQNSSGGFSSNGRAYLFSGSATPGSVVTAPTFTFQGTGHGTFFGCAVAGLGNLKGVVVGAKFDDTPGNGNRGKVYVYKWQANNTMPLAYVVQGDAGGHNLGHSVAMAGDYNGDGFDDFVAGAPFASAAAGNGGLVRVYSGTNGATLASCNGPILDGQMGYAVGNAGDINGDGKSDLIAGAPYENLNGVLSGTARIFSSCLGTTLYYGSGCPGQGGLVPQLSVLGCVDQNMQIRYLVHDGRPHAVAALQFGRVQDSVPLGNGCFDLVGQELRAFALQLDGAGGATKSIQIPATFTDGTVLTAQLTVVDAAAPGGFSNSNGTQITVH